MSDYYPQTIDYGPLFAPPRARATDPATSHAAAKRAASTAGGHREAIVEALAAGPAGQTEIARRAGLTVAAVSKRLKELRDAGRIERFGECRSGTGGREAMYRNTAALR
jgi:predicted Rossmann fold nucleotide-binding protein DprA/Smf involved in DNA uptake